MHVRESLPAAPIALLVAALSIALFGAGCGAAAHQQAGAAAAKEEGERQGPQVSAEVLDVVLWLPMRAWECVAYDEEGPRALESEALRRKVIEADIVYLGERHGVQAVQRAQADLALHVALQGAAPLILGVEMLPFPVQEVAEAWSEGALEEADFLEQVRWTEVWGAPWALYAPFFRLAAAPHVRLVALNAPRELSRAVYRHGLEGIGEEERARLPETFDLSDAVYRTHVVAALAHHPHAPEDPEAREAMAQRFYEAQLVWDETMAERLAETMAAEPRARAVVAAGAMHVAGGHGIPQRVERRGGPPGLRLLLQTEPLEASPPGLPVGVGDIRCRVGEPGD